MELEDIGKIDLALHPMNSGSASRILAGAIVKRVLELAAAKIVEVQGPLTPFILNYFSERGTIFRKNSVGQALRRLEQRRLIRQVVTERGVQLELTPQGRVRLDQWYLNDLVLPEPPAQWDACWRIVIFDVPEERRYLRSVFRRKLQQLGFRYLQKSVWIYPHPCEQVLTELAERLQLGRHIHIAVTQSLSSDAVVRANFSLTDLEGSEPGTSPSMPVARADRSTAEVTRMIDRPKLSSTGDETDELLPVEEWK